MLEWYGNKFYNYYVNCQNEYYKNNKELVNNSKSTKDIIYYLNPINTQLNVKYMINDISEDVKNIFNNINTNSFKEKYKYENIIIKSKSTKDKKYILYFLYRINNYLIKQKQLY